VIDRLADSNRLTLKPICVLGRIETVSHVKEQYALLLSQKNACEYKLKSWSQGWLGGKEKNTQQCGWVNHTTKRVAITKQCDYT